MLSETVSQEALAIIYEGECHSNTEIAGIIRSALERAHIAPWESVRTDIFTYGGRTLVMAYPAPPLLDRVGADCVRLKR